MIKTTKIFMGAILMLGIILSLSGPVHAIYYYNSGNSGHIQDESQLGDANVYYGWGMDFFIKDFGSTWAHIPVPLPSLPTKGVKVVFVEVQVIGEYGYVDKVHVYSGGAPLHEFNNLNWSAGNHAVKLNMQEVKNLSGPISISLECSSGDGTSRFIIKRVGANWVKK